MPIFELNLKLILPHHSLGTSHHLLPHPSDSSFTGISIHISKLFCHSNNDNNSNIIVKYYVLDFMHLFMVVRLTG